jgi:hypothetical protein
MFLEVEGGLKIIEIWEVRDTMGQGKIVTEGGS